VSLPGGGRLTPDAFQALGLMLGSGNGSHALHYLLEDAFLSGPSGPELSDSFLAHVQGHLSFAGGPLYAMLHEATYGQRSVSPDGTRWAAERIRAEFPQFDAGTALAEDRPVLFTGETIHPWMFATDPALAPLHETAELLANRQQWPDLYDADRLARNVVRWRRRSTTTTCTSTPPTRWPPRGPSGPADLGHRRVRTRRLRVSGGLVLDRLVRLVHGEI